MRPINNANVQELCHKEQRRTGFDAPVKDMGFDGGIVLTSEEHFTLKEIEVYTSTS
jgi:hypothetical protein